MRFFFFLLILSTFSMNLLEDLPELRSLFFTLPSIDRIPSLLLLPLQPTHPSSSFSGFATFQQG